MLRRKKQEIIKYSDQPLPLLELNICLNTESQSMDITAYNDQAKRILRANVAILIDENSKNDEFDASIPYLALNYFDQFISKHTLPTLGAKSVYYRVRVLAISCLCLAWKMRNKSFKNKIFLESKPHLNMDKKDVDKVESLILKEKKDINALCFVSNFMAFVGEQDESSKANVIELIIQSHGDIRFTQFKHSVIAASAILVVCSTGPDSEYKERFTGKKVIFVQKLDPNKLHACMLMMTVVYNKMTIWKIATPTAEAVEAKDLMNFELKWMNETEEDLTIHSSLFPPDPEPEEDCTGIILQKLICCVNID